MTLARMLSLWPQLSNTSAMADSEILANEKKLVLSQAIARFLIDHIYSYQQKMHPERMAFVETIYNDPGQSCQIAQELLRDHPDKFRIKTYTETIFEHLIYYYTTLEKSHLDIAIDLAKTSEVFLFGDDALAANLRNAPPEKLTQFYNEMLMIYFISTLCSLGVTKLFNQVLEKQPHLVNCEMEKAGISPLHLSVSLEQYDLVAQLLKSGAEVNKFRYLQPEDNDYPYIPTPLSLAVLKLVDNPGADYKVILEIIDLLLANGADPSLCDAARSTKFICQENYERVSPEVKLVFSTLIHWEAKQAQPVASLRK